MGHRLALYSVRVRRKNHGDEWRALGDIDEAGTWLGEFLQACLQTLDERDDHGHPVCRTRNVVPSEDPDVIAVAVDVGESGVASDLYKDGGEIVHRALPDVEVLKALVVFRLPPGSDMGTLGVHIPHNRGVKAFVTTAIQERWRERFEDLVLAMQPIVPRSVLRQAASDNRVRKVRLIKYGRSADEFQSRDRWGSGEDLGDVEVIIHRKRRRFLSGQPIVAYLDRAGDFNELFEFQGDQYDTLKVEVELAGKTRTIDVRNPTLGHAITYDLDAELSFGDGGQPTDASLLSAALSVMDVTGPG